MHRVILSYRTIPGECLSGFCVCPASRGWGLTYSRMLRVRVGVGCVDVMLTLWICVWVWVYVLVSEMMVLMMMMNIPQVIWVSPQWLVRMLCRPTSIPCLVVKPAGMHTKGSSLVLHHQNIEIEIHRRYAEDAQMLSTLYQVSYIITRHYPNAMPFSRYQSIAINQKTPFA